MLGTISHEKSVANPPQAAIAAQPIVTKEIPLYWLHLLPWVKDFCSYSQESYSPEYVREKLESGEMQAWLMKRGIDTLGVTLTEIRITEIKELVIIVCTGDEMREWHHLTAALEKYAKSIGCRKICAIARPGWERILKPANFVKTHVILEKML